MAVWHAIELLTALDRLHEAGVFDGIVTTAYPADWRTGSAQVHQRAAVVHARASYGAERYDAAVQLGAAMTYDQAVEHTLRALDGLVNEITDAVQI
jgi:hypothetical protein